jgi:predicted naringenin-chalcone synthase
MSSASALFVLERFIQERILEEGERAVLTALGPGFTAHNVLVRQG